jgi:hypothetical protein
MSPNSGADAHGLMRKVSLENKEFDRWRTMADEDHIDASSLMAQEGQALRNEIKAGIKNCQQMLALHMLKVQFREKRREKLRANSRKQSKKAICFNWRDDGFCKFGKRCRFSHDIKRNKDKKVSQPSDGSMVLHTENGDKKVKRVVLKDGSVVFFCVDGGANVHVICSVELFRRMINVRRVAEQVMMNSHGSPVKARGDLEVVIDGNTILLRDVAYIPESAHNIISASHLIDCEGGAMRYTKDAVTWLREGEAPVVGSRRNGLYFFSHVVCDKLKTAAAGKVLATEKDEMKKFRFNKEWAVDYMRSVHSRLHVGRRACRAILKRDQKELRLSNAQMSWLMQVTKAEMLCDSCERA